MNKNYSGEIEHESFSSKKKKRFFLCFHENFLHFFARECTKDKTLNKENLKELFFAL